MKQKLTFLAVMLAILAIPYNAIAEYDFSAVAPTGQTLYYTIINSSEVSVTYPSTIDYQPYDGFSEPTGDLSIPSTVTNDGTTYSVTSIGYRAFAGCSGLTSLTISNSVTSIGYSAFEDCSGLTSIAVENGNTVYDSRGNCNAIIETLTNTLVAGCMSTSIPNSVTSIGAAAFSGCRGLTSVTIPNSVTSIGGYAFFCCSGLTSVTIPNSVTSIRGYAFYGCSGLTSVTIPNSVTSIEGYVFSGCSGLTSIAVENSNTVYDSRENCNAIIETASNTLICGCANTTIPNSVTSIGDHAFSSCSGLTSVTIPNSVTSIGAGAFSGCSGLTSVTIPNSVTSIGESAFYSCRGLRSVTIPNSVTSIGHDAFGYGTMHIEYYGTATGAPWGATYMNCTVDGDFVFSSSAKDTLLVYIGEGGDVTIPNTVTSIGAWAFWDCSGLTSVTVPNSVTSIGAGAFYGCSGLASLTIGNSVTSIGERAFYGCSSLTEINCLSATAPTLGNYAFGQVDNTIPVNIPCGSMASYQSEWSYFSDFNEVFSTYTLDVYTSDDAMGSASITTLPNCNDNTAVVEATANAGYHFDHWSDGSTANPYTVQLTDNTTLIAHFSANTGIEEMDDSGILVYAKDHQIHIDAAIGETVNVYTIDGRTIATMPKATEHVAIPVTTAGVYLVKIGNRPAHKVVVVW